MSRFRSDRGDAAGSMVFALLSVILISAIVTITVAVVNQTSAISVTQATRTAVDQRMDAYVHDLRMGAPTPDKAQKCYPAQNTCVSVVSETAAGGTSTIVLRATRGTQSKDFSRTTVSGAAQRIVGFDSANNPVWG